MERELIVKLMAPRKKQRTGKFALVRYEGSKGLIKVNLEDIGVGPVFEGRTGTPRRSRKGRTYHAPNGSRKIVNQYGSAQVVSYMV